MKIVITWSNVVQTSQNIKMASDKQLVPRASLLPAQERGGKWKDPGNKVADKVPSMDHLNQPLRTPIQYGLFSLFHYYDYYRQNSYNLLGQFGWKRNWRSLKLALIKCFCGVKTNLCYKGLKSFMIKLNRSSWPWDPNFSVWISLFICNLVMETFS